MSFNILLVDDSSGIRHSLRSSLERNQGWKVCGEAENGQIAVQKVQDLNPDVVILDWQMPVMDGLEAARQISRVAPATRMVLLTLHSRQIASEEAKKAGIQQVFSKSDGISNLIAALKEFCAQASSESRLSSDQCSEL